MRPDRPHQERSIAAVVQAFRDGAKAPLLQSPTGSGKTHMGLRVSEMAIAKARERGTARSVVWFAHREELVEQPKNRILEDGWPVDDIAVLKAGRRSGLETASLVIASVQTARTKPHLLPENPCLVVLDEARHYVAQDWGAVVGRYGEVHRLGLDATPERVDGVPLRSAGFDVLIPGPPVRELVSAGHLVPSVIIAPAEYQDELADSPVDAFIFHAPGGRAILFASAVEHAHQYAERFCDIGIAAEAVDGTTAESVRKAALARFMRGDTRVLCNVRVLTEGTDLPPTDVIIHATGCGSLSDWIQKGGRGLRASPGKTSCKILDLCGCVHLYGFLDDEHEWSLDGDGKLRDGLPPIAQCSICFAWGRSAQHCVACGMLLPKVAPAPPRIKAADMQEVRKVDTEMARRSRLERWALEARRSGSLGKTLWRIAHKYRGTYGEDAPRAWIEQAIEFACSRVRDEEAAREAARNPLFAGR